MNTERLKAVVDLIFDIENRRQFQSQLTNLHQVMSTLTGNPGDVNFQNQFAQQLSELKKSFADEKATLTPAKFASMEDVGAAEFFLDDFPAAIERSVKDNPLSPAVARDFLAQFLSKRQ